MLEALEPHCLLEKSIFDSLCEYARRSMGGHRIRCLRLLARGLSSSAPSSHLDVEELASQDGWLMSCILELQRRESLFVQAGGVYSKPLQLLLEIQMHLASRNDDDLLNALPRDEEEWDCPASTTKLLTRDSPEGTKKSLSDVMETFDPMAGLDDALHRVPLSVQRQTSDSWGAVFAGEGADDAGGPYRESLTEIADELMDGIGSYPGLLVPTPNAVGGVGMSRDLYLLRPGSVRGDRGVEDARFFGRLLGMSIRNRNYMSLRLASFVWKGLALEPRALSDLELVDIASVNALKALRKNLYVSTDIYFEAIASNGDVTELIPEGSSTLVTSENVNQFCDLSLDFR